jgi:hypothetical protein
VNSQLFRNQNQQNEVLASSDELDSFRRLAAAFVDYFFARDCRKYARALAHAYRIYDRLIELDASSTSGGGAKDLSHLRTEFGGDAEFVARLYTYYVREGMPASDGCLFGLILWSGIGFGFCFGVSVFGFGFGFGL